MWAVNLLFKTNCEGAFCADNYKMTRITKDRSIYTHDKYHIRALHDTPSQMKEKYVRRWNRLNDALSAAKHKVLFIRLEENPTGRIMHPAHREHNRYDELHYIGEFIDILNEKYPELDFRVLFISHTCYSCSFMHRGRKVDVVHLPEPPTWENCTESLKRWVIIGTFLDAGDDDNNSINGPGIR